MSRFFQSFIHLLGKKGAYMQWIGRNMFFEASLTSKHTSKPKAASCLPVEE